MDVYRDPAVPEERALFLQRPIGRLENESILDIGCGDGSLTIRLGIQFGWTRLKGIEISEDGVAEASKNGVDAHEANLDLERIPFDDSTFDFVLCGEVTDHLFNPDYLLVEIRRIFRSSGLMLLATPNLAVWHDRSSLLACYQPMLIPVSLHRPSLGRTAETPCPAGRELIKFFTPKALTRVLTSKGPAID